MSHKQHIQKLNILIIILAWGTIWFEFNNNYSSIPFPFDIFVKYVNLFVCRIIYSKIGQSDQSLSSRPKKALLLTIAMLAVGRLPCSQENIELKHTAEQYREYR